MLQRLAARALASYSPFTQQQLRRHSVCRGCVVHNRYVGTSVSVLKLQSNVAMWRDASQLARANELSGYGIALQQAGAEAFHQVSNYGVVFSICCGPPLFHRYASIRDICVWRGFGTPEPVVNSAVQVKQTRLLLWVMECAAATRSNKSCHIVAGVVNCTSGGRKSGIIDNLLYCGWKLRQSCLDLQANSLIMDPSRLSIRQSNKRFDEYAKASKGHELSYENL
jgi:hypothetical protein